MKSPQHRPWGLITASGEQAEGESTDTSLPQSRDVFNPCTAAIHCFNAEKQSRSEPWKAALRHLGSHDCLTSSLFLFSAWLRLGGGRGDRSPVYRWMSRWICGGVGVRNTLSCFAEPAEAICHLRVERFDVSDGIWVHLHKYDAKQLFTLYISCFLFPNISK